MATFLNFLLTVTKTMMKVKISFGFKINPQRDIQWFDKCQKRKLYQSKRNCDKNKKNEALRKLQRAKIKNSLKEYDWQKISERHRKLKANQAKTTTKLDIETAITKRSIKDSPKRLKIAQALALAVPEADHLNVDLFLTNSRSTAAYLLPTAIYPKSLIKRQKWLKKLVEKYEVKFQI